MSRKGKVSAEEKLRIVEEYLGGKVGRKEAYEGAGIGKTTFKEWLSRYRTEGPAGFLPQEQIAAIVKR